MSKTRKQSHQLTTQIAPKRQATYTPQTAPFDWPNHLSAPVSSPSSRQFLNSSSRHAFSRTNTTSQRTPPSILLAMSPSSSPPSPAPRSPAQSETTQARYSTTRRPRSPRRHPCRCAEPHLPTSTTTTATTNSPTSRANSSKHPPPPPAPPYTPAVSFAATTAPALDVTAARACHNAATLSAVLADVVAALDDDARLFWCQMMDTLALHTAAGDVQYSVSIAPYLPWLAEQAYAAHHRALRFRPPHLCRRCGGILPSSAVPSSPVTDLASCAKQDGRLEFNWVDDEDEEDGDEIGNTQRLPIASFESYICDVLDEHGKNEFVRERYYGGALLNSRYLLAKFGTNLGMSPEEAQLRAADLLQCEEHIPFSDDDFMSGVSDAESQDRSDNGVLHLYS